MSDTVKLIIEIPTDLYEITKAKVDKNMTNTISAKSIANGIPLEDILEDIKAEILTLDYDIDFVDYDYNDMPMTDEIHTICREEVMQILDYIGNRK